MKSALMLVALLFAATACTKETDVGRCIGVFDEEDPTYRYDVSVKNAIIGTVLSGTVIVPAIVLMKQTFCPVGKR